MTFTQMFDMHRTTGAIIIPQHGGMAIVQSVRFPPSHFEGSEAIDAIELLKSLLAHRAAGKKK